MKYWWIALLLALGPYAARATCPHDDASLENWSSPSTWPNNQIPAKDHVVEITKPILLDTQTSDLGGVLIKDGGKLVFSPDHDVVLATRYVLIQNNGRLDIGSADCKYTRDTEIILLGNRDDARIINNFGQKFIGVDAGGSLEIHGADKLSWTKITETLSPKNLLYSTDIEGRLPVLKGFTFYEFARDGSLIKTIAENYEIEQVQTALASTASDSVVVVFKTGWFPGGWRWEKLSEYEDALETGLGIEAGTLDLTKTTGVLDAYVLVVDKSNPSGAVDSYDILSGLEDPDGTNTETLQLTADNVVYVARARNRFNKKGVIETYLEVRPDDFFDHVITVLDDPSSWNVGDTVVIASTDYDFEQAERFLISSVVGNQVHLNGHLKFMHYGEVYEGLDMRAEVGMLTRNIKVHGAMDPSCYYEDNDCEKYRFDSFGGHTKALRGFKAYNIEGAEFYHMGQMNVLGSYPIHFHLCLDTDADGTNPLIQSNAIHDTFSRCVTIHGSHGVHVKDNVAADHYGHCYFLEDGGEKRTVFDHNLGLGTREGILTPSDEEPTTFWITSPLATFTNNAAAGSRMAKGAGIWYLFPDEPVGPSEFLGLFEEFEAKYTPIGRFFNNVAHSNGKQGLALNKRLGPGHTIIGCSTYSPRVEAGNKDSEYQPVVFDTLHAYKNGVQNVIVRSTTTDLVNFYLGDSLRGVKFNRNMLGGYQRIRDSVIIGETPNMGSGGKYYGRVTPDAPKTSIYSERSLPQQWSFQSPVYGIEIDAEGPTHISDVKFINFKSNTLRVSSAITWNDDYRFHNGATTSIKGVSFESIDDVPDVRMTNQIGVTGKSESTILMTDLDGSLTGQEKGVVTVPSVYYTKKAQCTPRADWNLQVCDGKYAKFYLWPMLKEDMSTFITDASNSVAFVAKAVNTRISYSVPVDGESYVFNYNTTMPTTTHIRVSGLDAGDTIRVGVCLPKAAGSTAADLSRVIFTESTVEMADSLQDLDTKPEKNVYFDRTKSIVYRKFAEDRVRDPDVELSDCIGGLKNMDACPFIKIRLHKIIQEQPDLDLNDVDCRGR